MTRKEKDAHIATEKQKTVERYGCLYCHAGKVIPATVGFEQYWWEEILGIEAGSISEVPYVARRFVFKYSDPRESDVPVSQLSRSKTVTICEIDEALARCVILCRSCADPRRTRKDDKCQKATSISD